MQYVAKILFCVLKNEVDCKKILAEPRLFVFCYVTSGSEMRYSGAKSVQFSYSNVLCFLTV